MSTECDFTGDAIHPVLAGRFSARRFDPHAEVSGSSVRTLIDAARWAPSAGNSQPWGFHVTRRGTPDHERVLRNVAGSARGWAADAGALVVTAARRYLDDPDLPYSEFADHDLGQAVAHLTIQAEVMGLSCHQFRAFDHDGLTAELRPRPGWQIVAMIAVGHPLDEAAPVRERHSVEALLTEPWHESR